ncbi:MAG: MotA/TolQ/ExbB proton channel family protein [Planctomycetota bacterium]|nr:MotA/TolQ/ExbB proton channel family protein [Planctomycetota bacterium]
MRTRRSFIWKTCLWVLVVFMAGTVWLYAQTPAPATDPNAAAAPQAAARKSMVDMIKAGGLVGHCIILINVGSFALAIELFMTLKRDKLCPPHLIGEIEALLEEENYEEALALCDSNKSFMTAVMAAGIAKVGLGYDQMRTAMQEAGDFESFKLNTKINWLSLIYQVGPMLGLFGTVTGMIGAFQVIENTANPSPKQLARGIYEALVTTVEGLIVAMPTLTVFFYFKARLGRLLTEAGIVTEELVERFRPAQQ